MPRFLLHWLVTAVALGAAARLVPGIHIASGPILVFAALVLGFVNAVVRPVLVVLTLPLTVLTLGIFYFIVNAAAFGLAAALVPGFTVASLGSAVLGSIIVALVSWACSGLIRAAAVGEASRRR
jgi:putative membrane protein